MFEFEFIELVALHLQLNQSFLHQTQLHMSGNQLHVVDRQTSDWFYCDRQCHPIFKLPHIVADVL